ncbi:MAG: hydantoinase/oxoprolinase family protein [Clostridiales bacterium]
MIKIAIDTGGTFTDYTSVGSLNGSTEQRIFVKNPTNHQNPAQGILEGLKELAKAWNTDLKTLLSETEQLTHGATLALNALLEKKGVKTALFTTEGFRDALEIRRSQLKNQWDLRALTPEVLVPRRLRLGIEGRVDYKGEEITPLNEDAVRKACLKCKAQGVKAIGVCFLFSFLNPNQEKRTAEIIKEELPNVFVSLSSDVAPRIREYERTATTVINAYLTPILADYLNIIKAELQKYGWNKPIHIMENSGGLRDVEAVSKLAVKTLLSGPGGGAVGNESLGKIIGKSHTVLADMGGTSFDIHVISGGKNSLVPQSELAGYPLSIPMIDISSIGAGGGSIAHVDMGGRILVGPNSAGSVPGPCCYNRGGEEATVTDALLVLGLVDEENFLGGRLPLSKEKAYGVMKDKIAAPLGVSVMEAAQIVYGIAAEMMADALRLVTMQKGNDPRIYSLLAAGGAFPLFAVGIMESLHMPEVLIPIQGPVFCAWGMLGASCRFDISRSFFMEKEKWNEEALKTMVSTLKKEGEAELLRLGVEKQQQQFEVVLEMRYLGQHHEISVEWGSDSFNKDEVDAAFHNVHKEIYEYAEYDQDWEIVDIRLSCFAANIHNQLFDFDKTKTKNKVKTVNGKIFGVKGEIDVPIFGEGDLDKPIIGPSLVEFDYTTAVIPQGYVGVVEHTGILTIKSGVQK